MVFVVKEARRIKFWEPATYIKIFTHLINACAPFLHLSNAYKMENLEKVKILMLTTQPLDVYTLHASATCETSCHFGHFM